MLSAVRPLWVPQRPFCEPLHVTRPGTVDFCRFELQFFKIEEPKIIHLEGDIFPVEDRPEGIYFRPKVSWLFCLLNYLDIFSSLTEDHIFLQGYL